MKKPMDSYLKRYEWYNKVEICVLVALLIVNNEIGLAVCIDIISSPIRDRAENCQHQLTKKLLWLVDGGEEKFHIAEVSKVVI